MATLANDICATHGESAPCTGCHPWIQPLLARVAALEDRPLVDERGLFARIRAQVNEEMRSTMQAFMAAVQGEPPVESEVTQ